jgi:hypothetical protein
VPSKGGLTVANKEERADIARGIAKSLNGKDIWSKIVNDEWEIVELKHILEDKEGPES